MLSGKLRKGWRPMDDDQPKSLKNPEQIALRVAALSKPEIIPLADFVKTLGRDQFGDVPNFDPYDGGVNAEALFLLEKPGEKAIESGFVSRNNNDDTAANILKFMKEADICRTKTCLWNAVPGRKSPGKPTPFEIQQGAMALSSLLRILEKVRVVVLVGNEAGRAWLSAENLRPLPIINSAHPSPVTRKYNLEMWQAIPAQWAKVKPFLS
jgi:uracil-DNA glycosylase